MTPRAIEHTEQFPVAPEVLFQLLVTPSAIRQWWNASTAIVVPRERGTWAAAWGPEDNPDYVTIATIRTYDPPHVLELADFQYTSQSGGLPFQADLVTAFSVRCAEPLADANSALHVRQSGFPADGSADEFMQGCVQGWRDTFAGIRRYLASRG